MATFLDPRFQGIININDLEFIRKKFETSAEIGVNHSIVEPTTSQKLNTGLSSLFPEYSTNLKKKQVKRQARQASIDFRTYTENAMLSLEKCPLKWWKDNGNIYPKFEKLVGEYLCCPVFVNQMYRLKYDNQTNLLQRYNDLGNISDIKLLWLYLNSLRSSSRI